MKNNSSNQDPYSTLFDDIRSGNTEMLAAHYANHTNGDLTIKNSDGQTLLMVAIDARNQPAVDMILNTNLENRGLNLVDKQGNSVLHYAVAARDLLLIQRLSLIENMDIQRPNNDGETAADWLQFYQVNFFARLDRLPLQIEVGDLSAIKTLLFKEVSLRLRYQQGDTALHLAIRHNQPKLVREILLKSPDRNQLLTSKNFMGQTPLDLAEQMMSVEQVNNNPVLDLLSGAELGLLPSVQPVQSTTEPEVDAQKAAELADILAKGVTENDFVRLQSYLPTLVSLARTSCQQTLETLQAARINQSGLSKQHHKLLSQLFGVNSNSSDLMLLEKKIIAITRHLDKIQTDDNIKTFIAVGNDRIKERRGFVVDNQQAFYLDPTFPIHETIHLNPVHERSLLSWVSVFIHEVSHLANGSEDLAYLNQSRWNGDGHVQNISALQHLAHNGEMKQTWENPDSFQEMKSRILVTQGVLSGNIDRKINAQELNSLFNVLKNWQELKKQTYHLDEQSKKLQEKATSLDIEKKELNQQKNKIPRLKGLNEEQKTKARNDRKRISDDIRKTEDEIESNKHEIKNIDAEFIKKESETLSALIQVMDLYKRFSNDIKKSLAFYNAETLANFIVGITAINDGDLYFSKKDDQIYSKNFLYDTGESLLHKMIDNMLAWRDDIMDFVSGGSDMIKDEELDNQELTTVVNDNMDTASLTHAMSTMRTSDQSTMLSSNPVNASRHEPMLIASDHRFS